MTVLGLTVVEMVYVLMALTPSAATALKDLLASSAIFWTVTTACQTPVAQMVNVLMASTHLAASAVRDSPVDCAMFWRTS